MQPTPPTASPSLQGSSAGFSAELTNSRPLKKRKTEASSSATEIEALKNMCFKLQKTVQQQQQTLEQMQKEIKQLSGEMPRIAAMTFQGITEDYQSLKIEIVSPLKTGGNSVLTLFVDKLKAQKKCRFIQSYLIHNPNDSCVTINLASLKRTDFSPKLVASVIFWCQSFSALPMEIDDSNVEMIRSVAIWLEVDKLITRCDQFLTQTFEFEALERATVEKPRNDAILNRLLAIQSSEPTKLLGEKIAQFILNRLLVAPSIDTELHSRLMNYKHYMSELVLQIDTEKHFNFSLLKEVFKGNKTITNLELHIFECKKEVAPEICASVAELCNLKEVRICGSETSYIINFVKLLAQTPIKLDLLQLKQWGEEELEGKLMRLPVRSLTEKLELKHPYALHDFEELQLWDRQKVTCNSFPFNPKGFGTEYDDVEQDLSTEELEFVVSCPSIQELVFDKYFKSQYLDTASVQFFSSLAKSNISSLVLPPPYAEQINFSSKKAKKTKKIDFTSLQSFLTKIDNYNATNPITKIDHVTLRVSANLEKHQLIGIKQLFNTFELTVKFIKFLE